MDKLHHLIINKMFLPLHVAVEDVVVVDFLAGGDEVTDNMADVVADVKIINPVIGINAAMCHNIVGHTAHAPIPAGSAKILHRVITTMRLLKTNLGGPPTIVHGLLDSLGVIQQ